MTALIGWLKGVCPMSAYRSFISDPSIDPTSNLAEQAIRFVAIHRRMTRGMRSELKEGFLDGRRNFRLILPFRPKPSNRHSRTWRTRS